MATWNNNSKATSVFQNFLRHGSATILNDIKDFTFESVAFNDGTLLKDVTFAELVDQVWANQSKSVAPTFTNATKN